MIKFALVIALALNALADRPTATPRIDLSAELACAHGLEGFDTLADPNGIVQFSVQQDGNQIKLYAFTKDAIYAIPTPEKPVALGDAQIRSVFYQVKLRNHPTAYIWFEMSADGPEMQQVSDKPLGFRHKTLQRIQLARSDKRALLVQPMVTWIDNLKSHIDELAGLPDDLFHDHIERYLGWDKKFEQFCKGTPGKLGASTAEALKSIAREREFRENAAHEKVVDEMLAQPVAPEIPEIVLDGDNSEAPITVDTTDPMPAEEPKAEEVK